MQMIQEGNCLDSFTETHFICQDAVSVFIPIFNQPIQTLKLELFQHTIVLENRYVLSTILPGLFARTIKQIQFLLHFGNVGVLDNSVLRLLIELKEKLMDFVVNLDSFSGLTIGNFVPVFKL